MNNGNTTIIPSTEQEIANMERPCGRDILTDEKLYQLCQTYGERTRFWRQKFAGLLPEVFKRRLYEKKGFSSIFEFAAKLAGMSHEQVRLVLRLERKFEDKPVLQKALVEGEISANKLVRIASIATVQNQEEIFEKAKILSNRAVEVFVRDVKMCNGNFGQNHGEIGTGISGETGSGIGDQNNCQAQASNGSVQPLFDSKSMHVHFQNKTNSTTLQLAPDVEKELLEMQEKGIDINTFLRKSLQKRKEEIEQEKTRLACEQEQQTQMEPLGRYARENQQSHAGKHPSEEPRRTRPITHYVPAKIKKIIKEEHGTKCSAPNCQRPAKILHHTARFALTQNHNPQFLAPLCEAHHEIAHKIDMRYMACART
ncbi:MAG: hypothetical protein WC285_01610 [Candidatus Gracilibacteria bacterium]|jgi:hypothetical protein